MEKTTFAGKTYNLEWCGKQIEEGQNVTQVSGFVFDKDGRILIVKIGKYWTVPGGHPERGERYLDTLNREVEEEANVTIAGAELIGYVRVTPEHDEPVHYQVRYRAKVKRINEGPLTFESSARKFVEVSTLKDYIKWFDSPTFQEQLRAALQA